MGLLSFLKSFSMLKLPYFSLSVNCYYVFLTLFIIFVSEPHDFAFALDPGFIFSAQTIQTSYSFCPKSPYYPLKPNSSQNFMVRDEISCFEPNPLPNSYGSNRNALLLDQKSQIPSQNHTSTPAQHSTPH